MKSGFWERRNVIKTILEDEKFNLSRFLEALLIFLSNDVVSGKNADLWHKISALRRDSESYNINPRLQFECHPRNESGGIRQITKSLNPNLYNWQREENSK